MRGNFASCLDFTLLPGNDGQPFHVDSGGATSWGVTRANWSRWIGRNASVADMKLVTKQMTFDLYYTWFWRTIAGDSLPSGLDLMVFDMGVTCGEPRSAILLQQVLGFTGHDLDGDIGPLTLGRLNGAESLTDIIDRLSGAQEHYYRGCSTFDVNGNGWLARLARRKAAAHAMRSPAAS